MADDRQIIAEETGALRGAPPVTTAERDAAVDAAARAGVTDAAMLQVPRRHGETARGAQTHAATLDALRQSALDVLDDSAKTAGGSRVGLYLLTGVLLTSLVIALMWLGSHGA